MKRLPDFSAGDAALYAIALESGVTGQPPFRSGPMVYRTIVTRYCPEGIEEDTSIPDVKFYLEAQ